MIPAPGVCADGSGNWLPMAMPDGTFVPICPSDPRYPLYARGTGATERPNASLALGGLAAILVVMGVLYFVSGKAAA